MSLKHLTVAAVLAFASVASAGLQPSPQEPVRGSDTVRGCFSSKGELTLMTSSTSNSRGKCNEACRAKNKNVAATSLDDCFCGDKYPASSAKVDDEKCGEPCPSYDLEACGGLDTYSVFNTGVRVSVGESADDAKSSSSSSSPSSTSSAPADSTTAAPAEQTSGESGAPESGGSKSNTVGIAVGVVCGILAVAGAAGAAFFFLRRRRNTEIEEEHRRNAAVNAFISGGKPPSSSGGMSMSDSRLDPVLVNRRMSDGSIADNQDYSRRILRVTNA